jgi:hypothetical protein
LALMTAGDDVAQIAQFLPPGCDSYTAADVVRLLLAEKAPPKKINGKIRTRVGLAELALAPAEPVA